MQRLALVVAGILVIVLIILLERTINVDIIDEKKLLQDLAGELLPKMAVVAVLLRHRLRPRRRITE